MLFRLPLKLLQVVPLPQVGVGPLFKLLLPCDPLLQELPPLLVIRRCVSGRYGRNT